MNKEPVLSIAGVTAAVSAIVGLLVAFGVEVTEAQAVAILAVVGTVGPLVVALFARPKVTPNSNVVAFKTPDTSARHAGRPAIQAGDASVLPTGTPVEVTELHRAA